MTTQKNNFQLPCVFSTESSLLDFSKSDFSVAYSGKVLNTFDSQGNPIRVIFDLDSANLIDERYPMLYEHNPEAWVTSFLLSVKDYELVMTDFKLLNTSYAKDVNDAIQAHFPVKSSVRIHPQVIEFIPDSETAIVNGQEVSNVYVYRDFTIAEVSATSIPVDKDTPLKLSAKDMVFFNINDKVLPNAKNETTEILNMSETEGTKIQESHNDSEAILAMQAQMSDLQSKFSTLEKENAALKVERTKFQDEIADMALKTRVIAIDDLQGSMDGVEFIDEERQWMLDLDEQSFAAFSKMFKRVFSTLMEMQPKQEDAEDGMENMETMENEEMSEKPKQFSKKNMPRVWFSDQAKPSKGQKQVNSSLATAVEEYNRNQVRGAR